MATKFEPWKAGVRKWVGPILHIYCPLYQQTFYYIDCKNRDEFKAVMKKQLKLVFDDDRKAAGGVEIIDNTKYPGIYVCVIFCDSKRPSVVAHETLHAVLWLAEKKGIDTSDEESLCYLQEYLVSMILGK